MAEQGRDGASGRKTGGTSKKAATGGVADLREALHGLIDPLGMVMLTRERIEDALNDAVSRGRVTADDAQDLAAALVERGRRQTNDVLGDLERLLAAKAGKARRATSRGARKPSARSGSGIAGYDDLSAKQVVAKLADLTPAGLRRVRDYERSHANRKTVLRAIDGRLK